MFKRHYLGIALGVSLVVTLASVTFLGSLLLEMGRKGDWITIAFIVSAISVGLVLGRRRHRNARKQPLPESSGALIRQLERELSSGFIPYREHLVAPNKAIIHALYGEFDQAEAALETVSWQDVPDAIDAARFHARAVVSYLRGGAPQQGLNHARRAQRLSGEPPAFALQRTRTLRVQAFYVAWGEALTCQHTSTTSSAIEALLTDMSPVIRALAQAALADVREAQGDSAGAQVIRDALRKAAPFAHGLLRNEREPAHESAVALPASVATTRGCAVHRAEPAQITCLRCGAFACSACAKQARAARWFCARCAARLTDEAGRLAERDSRARGLAAFPMLVGVMFTLLMIASWTSPLYSPDVGVSQAVAGSLPAGTLSYLSIRSALQLWRAKRSGASSLVPWLVGMMFIPFGTLLSVYALFTLRSRNLEPLYSDDYLDGSALRGCTIRASRLMLCAAVLAVLVPTCIGSLAIL